jgi:hypothetical protein
VLKRPGCHKNIGVVSIASADEKDDTKKYRTAESERLRASACIWNNGYASGLCKGRWPWPRTGAKLHLEGASRFSMRRSKARTRVERGAKRARNREGQGQREAITPRRPRRVAAADR